MSDVESSAERSPLVGLKIVCVLLLAPIALTLLSAYIPMRITKIPREEKLELLQHEAYKKRNIRSVEEFDAYWRKMSTSMVTPLFVAHAGITAVLVVGLWRRRKWARLPLIIYLLLVVASQIAWSSGGGTGRPGFATGRISSWAISGIAIFYLTRPKVKRQFH